jgi:type IV secretion system protein VirB10
MVGTILITCFSMFFFSASDKNLEHSLEENYAVQSSSPIDKLKAQPVPVQPATNTTTTAAQFNPALVQEQLALIQAKKDELQQRLSAPLMLVNNSQPNKTDAPAQAGVTSTDRNTQFLNQAATQVTEIATAKPIGHLNSLIAEGSLIHAILELATNSDLPGFVRASVSEPSYSEDGTQVLIPRGSRLIGQYKSGMLQGQSRIFMVWTRLITPSGMSIQLGSPGVDSLGVAGMGADEINRHFWERFGTGSLLSMIGAGAANAGVSPTDQENSASAYRAAVANSFAQSASQSLQQDSKIPPTLTTYQGKPIMVFVAKDLSFEGVMKQTKSKVNVF